MQGIHHSDQIPWKLPTLRKWSDMQFVSINKEERFFYGEY